MELTRSSKLSGDLQFGTTFEVRSAARPDGKVTDGVWLECAQQSTSRTLIFDIEGLDGFERMNDPDLERQFSLLALASADTLLLNIDYRDVERVHGGNLALLRTIIQVSCAICKTLSYTVSDWSSILAKSLMLDMAS